MSGKVGTKTKVYFLHSYLIFVRKAVIREYTYMLMTLNDHRCFSITELSDGPHKHAAPPSHTLLPHPIQYHIQILAAFHLHPFFREHNQFLLLIKTGKLRTAPSSTWPTHCSHAGHCFCAFTPTLKQFHLCSDTPTPPPPFPPPPQNVLKHLFSYIVLAGKQPRKHRLLSAVKNGRLLLLAV